MTIEKQNNSENQGNLENPAQTMSEWKEYKLGELTDWFSGGTPSKDNANYWQGIIPWISAKTMTWHMVSTSELNISDEGLKNGSRLANANDILLLVRGSGLFNDIPICLVKKPVSFNQDIKAIRAKDIKYQEFIYYWLHGNKKGLYEILEETGIGAGKFDTDLLKNLDISIPLVDSEREVITTIARSIFDKIDLLHRQNATLEAMAETLFRQMMSEHDLNGLKDDQDKTRSEKSCQSINPENHVQDKGEAKEDWETKQLKEVTDIGIGRTPPRKEFQWFSTDPNDVKWISIKDMGSDGVFISNTSEYLTRKAIKTFNIPVIPEHTVVLSFKMTVGRVAITSDEMLSNEAIAHFKFKKNTPFTKEYLFLFLKTFKYDLLGSTSSIVTSINSAMIKDMEITIPDASTMNEFKEITEPLFNKINQNQIQIRTLTALRDNLLPKLMSGEVRVKM